MKFAREYQEALERDEYPKAWVESAVPYKKLKKCIKRVQQELESLGLDHETLQQLWQQGSIPATLTRTKSQDRVMNYNFLDDGSAKFVPKLTIALDPRDGSPMDAWLSSETRQFLRKYSRRTSGVAHVGGAGHVFELPDGANAQEHPDSEFSEVTSPNSSNETAEEIETIEIPLTSDSEFFQILRQELASLEKLQKEEQRQLEGDIVKLGNSLRDLQLSKRDKKKAKEELNAWREIFRLYNDAEVFFSSHEVDAGTRDATHAQKQLAYFTKTLSTHQQDLKLTPEAKAALDRFMRINFDLLQFMKYQEINKTALTKIMKKFDKQTALHAKDGVLTQINKTPFMAQDLAKATCYTISNELLQLIPQIDDYLCPICFSIAWRPIRLRCSHVFCLRCLAVMQRAGTDECPLCREGVILEATEHNLDHELAKFLKKNFPQEVKEKQRENEIAAGVEQFGPGYTGTHRCVVM